jgi:predicted RNA-binding protein with PIN domain
MAGRPLLVVDAANVMGARPDGWWRDRAGAARRLLSRLSKAFSGEDAEGPEVVVVLEGAARPAAREGLVDGIRVVHAPRVGDDKIVEIVAEATKHGGRPVTVVTADRGLRERVTALGADTMGPRTLWQRLDRAEV